MEDKAETGKRPRMLVVDDERAIADMLASYFRMEGYEVQTTYDGASALRHADPALDIVLLDVQMPGMDGYELCRRLREHLSCPIIFLTARIEDADQIDGFAAGADDYVLKPFSLEVLGRRVAAHVAREGRRRSDDAGSVRFFGPVTVDYGRRAVSVRPEGGEAAEVDLTRTEFDIVALLSKSPARVFDRDLIYERVWGWEAAGDSGIVREHVRRIRRKFRAAGLERECIETVWGVGYTWGVR